MTPTDGSEHYRDTFAGRDERLTFRNVITGEVRVVGPHERQHFTSARRDGAVGPEWEQLHRPPRDAT